ncbi:hypothetical protein JJQ72_02155 [Paenibacillus sp. F411]|uniref:hypothetical protein n=1 Tax=Paenibacillus sp. F411 TaxID=2820239 RepID=UPI001AAFB938|nr:hypothetical protein [Paenibacillus sp. F411]MBO2942788.1 hypothetical protein [Paenibacillus sp. F411]
MKDNTSYYMESNYTNREKLFTHFKSNLTTKKLLFDNKSYRYFITSIILLMLAVLFIISAASLSWLNKPSYVLVLLFVSGISLFIISLALTTFSVKESNKYIAERYPFYKNLFNDKTTKALNEEVLTALRCDLIYESISTWSIDLKNLEELIDYYELKGQELKNTKWYPITLWALIIFPVYAEFIATLYNPTNTFLEKVLLLLALLLGGTLLFWYINKFRLILNAVLLFEADKYKELARVLRIIKTFP